MAFYSQSLFLVLLSSFAIVFSSIDEIGGGRGGVTVDLIHRDSPLSPFYNPSESNFQRLRNSVARSFLRRSILKKLPEKDLTAPVASNNGEYLMKIGIGTPPVQIPAIADTGSDLTWIQCQPCTNCYNQTAPFFDPSKTSTYRSVPCTSPKCQLAANGGGGGNCDNVNSCLYQVSYGDNSYSNGNLAVETLTFTPASSDAGGGGAVAFSGVVFGCGHDNQGTFDAKGTGIIGLGGGAVSIVRQLNSSIGGKFSYCLTSVNSNATSKIKFGGAAAANSGGANVSSTPLVRKSVDTFYYLTLVGVSVGANRFPAKVVPKQPGGGDGNIIIDSGTTVTFLPGDVYGGLETAMVNAVKGKRVADPQGMFQLCYEVAGNGGLRYPPVTVHFDGADVAVAPESVFMEVEKGVACLTFVPASESVGMAIFGNLHQINNLIGYDLEEMKLSFKPMDCTAMPI
ncbi:aspartic proteinase CDR1-like [Andrographis paniculata]|uniref:aspartic proteinase CDR1-like n=1 Tax=Andrographis paniculata TaxID=175694 RepID=UPI0021E7B221|nr:aspartic proteinase CDR1-like [Andrographis paniculata]